MTEPWQWLTLIIEHDQICVNLFDASLPHLSQSTPKKQNFVKQFFFNILRFIFSFWSTSVVNVDGQQSPTLSMHTRKSNPTFPLNHNLASSSNEIKTDWQQKVIKDENKKQVRGCDTSQSLCIQQKTHLVFSFSLSLSLILSLSLEVSIGVFLVFFCTFSFKGLCSHHSMKVSPPPTHTHKQCSVLFKNTHNQLFPRVFTVGAVFLSW